MTYENFVSFIRWREEERGKMFMVTDGRRFRSSSYSRRKKHVSERKLFTLSSLLQRKYGLLPIVNINSKLSVVKTKGKST